MLTSVKHMHKELEAKDIYCDEMIDSLITRMLIKSIRSLEGKPTNEGISQAVRYIDENIQQDIDFRALAHRQHYSFDRFRHVFKEHTGYSPHQYVIHGRIERARFLLELNPDMSLTEVSYNCGFSSSSHFTKAFRSKVGMTPSEYARSQKKSND
ncbi:MAG: helix-turn-helix transcriptional regulator [Clostridia bacterium]|nr:helix-turn-helix transcriptional regulator [Clostridia bacterium]